jgi:hypothetical protein
MIPVLCGTRERVAVSTTVRFRHRVAFWALSAASISAHDGARQTCSSPFVVMDPRRLPSGENAVRNKTAAWPRSGRVGWRCEQFRPMASCVSALSSIVANGHQVLPSFPPPPLFIPYGGFSPVRLEASLSPSTLPSPFRISFDAGLAIHPFLAFLIQASGIAAVPTGPWLSMVYHVRTFNRYYGLIRQSGELRPAYRLFWSVFALAGRPPHLPFFALSHLPSMPLPLPRRLSDFL